MSLVATTALVGSASAAPLPVPPLDPSAYPKISEPTTPPARHRNIKNRHEIDTTNGDSRIDLTASPTTDSFQTLGAVTPTRYYIGTNSGWVTLKGVPYGFALGLGKNGWGIDIGQQATGSRMGYVKGTTMNNVNGYTGPSVGRCLWVLDNQATQLTGGAAQNDCRSVPSINRDSEFMSFYNGDNYCQPDGSCDGTPTQINGSTCPGGAPVLGNVRPWTSQTVWGDYGIYTIPPNAWIRWRWVTKDYQFIMVRNPNSSAQGGPAQDWGFIPATCLQDRLGPVWAPPRS